MQPDRARCYMHGGATPPKRGEDLLRAQTQRITYGLRTQLATVLGIAERAAPGIIRRLVVGTLPLDARTDLTAEIVFARRLLALTCLVEAACEIDCLGPQMHLIDLIRELAVAQHRGGRSVGVTGTALGIVVRVVGERLPPEELPRLAPVLELRRPPRAAPPARRRRAA